ncbi:MAG: hypothetical protein ICV74_09470 [Thermoleophilia bacterium]|nr:hypothetical protein [Thermoleophilia bacterium]
MVELDEATWFALVGGNGQGGTVNACATRTRPWTCSEVATGLPIPTAVAIDRGTLYVTLFGLVPGEAQVARLR